jgi:hypothetical protein
MNTQVITIWKQERHSNQLPNSNNQVVRHHGEHFRLLEKLNDLSRWTDTGVLLIGVRFVAEVM